MIHLRIEDIFPISNKGYLISVRGDCSKIRIGSILVYPDGREVVVDGVATMCGGFWEDAIDLLIKEGIDVEQKTVYLKEGGLAFHE